jgi:hypothetical protein
MTLNDLKAQALRSAEWRGHSMTSFNSALTSACTLCDLGIFIDENPTFGLKIGGPALECLCEDESALLESAYRG